MIDYQKSLELFQIKSGFVEEQLEPAYAFLKEKYDLEKYEFLSPKYMEASKAQHEILMAYYTLKSYYKTYIVSGNSILEGNIVESILRLINDFNGKIDEMFIASLVEIMVSNMHLNDYARKIEFKKYGDKLETHASYNGKNNTIIFYISSIEEYMKNNHEIQLSPIERKYSRHCQVVRIVRHEIEHANHKAILEMNEDNVITRILKATEISQKNFDEKIEKIIRQPFPIRNLMTWKMYLEIANYNRKYSKYWEYIPDERLAEICGVNLVLNLLEKMEETNHTSFGLLKEYYQNQLLKIIRCGYEKTLSPALFYFNKLKQYKDCLDIIDMSQELSIEERMALGLKISPQELDEFLENSEISIQKICTLYSNTSLS